MKKDLHALFARYPEIKLAYQYGSSIKQNFARARDIDIAVLLKKIPSAERRLELQLELNGDLAKLYAKLVDLIFLNTASPFLTYQVIKYGRLLYGAKTTSSEFVVKTLTRYFDALFLHQFFTNRLEKKLGVNPHGR